MDHPHEDSPTPPAPANPNIPLHKTKRFKVIGGAVTGAAAVAAGAVVAVDLFTGPKNEANIPTATPTESAGPIQTDWNTTAPVETPSPSANTSEQIQQDELMSKDEFAALPWTERFDYNANIIPLDEKQKSRELWYEESQNPEDIYPETISVNSSPEDILKISTDYLRQAITSHNIVLDSSGIPNWDKIQNFDQEKAEKLLSAGFYYTDDGWYGRGADIIDELYNNGEASNGPDYYVLRNLAGVPDLVWASELYTLPGVDGQELPARFIEASWDDLRTGQTTTVSEAYVWVEYPDDSPYKTADTPGTWLDYGHLVDRPAS